VADFGRELGIAGLALNDDGMAIFALDDGAAVVAIGFNKPAGALDLMVCLADVDPSPARSLAALRANFGSRGPGCETFATDPSSGAYVLQRRYVGPDLVEGGLAGAVHELLDGAQRWTARLNAIAATRGPSSLP
jgi:Tir chaperone protein (CesT).